MRSARAISGRRERQAIAFYDRLLGGERAYHGFWTLPLDLLAGTIAPAYLAIGRFGLAKLQVASDACDGCGVCTELCPKGAIRMIGRRPFWTFGCESCMRCYSVCPKKAVQCSHPFMAVQLAATALTAAPLALLTDRISTGVAPLAGTAAHWALACAGSILFFFVGYRLLDALMRIPRVAWLLSRASFNQYWRRYLAPGIKVKDLSRNSP